MTLEKITDTTALVHNENSAPIFSEPQDALDLLGNAWQYDHLSGIIVMKEDISEKFFDLKTGTAGEILQKFINYGMRISLVGDFSVFSSKSLKDFIYESNKGDRISFVKTLEEAVIKLSA